MAKILLVLALASAATAVDPIGYRASFGGGGLGYPGGGLGGVGVSKHISSSVGPSYASHLGGIGVSKHVSSSVGSSYGGLGPAGIGGIGVSKQVSTLGGAISPFGVGYGGIGLSKQISSVGSHHHHLGGIGYGGINKFSTLGVNSIGHGGFGYGGYGGFGGFGGYGGLGSHLYSGFNRFAIPTYTTLPGGYYGGVMAYPQPFADLTHHHHHDMHYPGSHSMDHYKGYYGGYFPGSIGYGHSYRFFH